MGSQGFLGRGAPLGAEVNLLVQLGLGALLLAGVLLARRGRYVAHGVCQGTAYVATVAMTVIWMVPSLRDNYGSGLARGVVNRVNVAVAAHLALGAAVVLLGAYVVLVAATPLVPPRLRFVRYRPWMLTLLSLWWASIALGVLTYWWATS
ncbi:MAG: hypothetical protein HY294_17100 [Candidatus Rokubacteria bacterium]|nr:hypothetical protein [Candidatus Rokubacteria bacterium]